MDDGWTKHSSSATVAAAVPPLQALQAKPFPTSSASPPSVSSLPSTVNQEHTIANNERVREGGIHHQQPHLQHLVDKEGKEGKEGNEQEEEDAVAAAAASSDAPFALQWNEPTAPAASDIHISTKTKIAFLSAPIALEPVFWAIPVQPYFLQSEGVVKKQMKFNTFSAEHTDKVRQLMMREQYYEELVISHTEHPPNHAAAVVSAADTASTKLAHPHRVPYRDVRKISIGLCKKDVLNTRSKKKSAFYNCFVLILRVRGDVGTFREFHVKVFNTGKLEIPGIQCEHMFERVMSEILRTLRPHVGDDLCFRAGGTETVLINSNFSCNYFINRDKLYELLHHTFGIQAMYDPCSYPGVQCKFHYYPHLPLDQQTGRVLSATATTAAATAATMKDTTPVKSVVVSFMVFRTGSVLVVGHCDETVIQCIYQFLCRLFREQYDVIRQHLYVSPTGAVTVPAVVPKKKKSRPKNLSVSMPASLRKKKQDL